MSDTGTYDADAAEVIEVEGDHLPAVRQHEALIARAEISVEEVVEQRDKVVQVMRSAMKEDVHYGKIPGVKNPTLLKPGAELLNFLLRLAPSYRSERTFHDDGHLTVVSYCTLTHIPTGLVIASGEGLCSTRESKYAYRNQKPVCPACGAEAIIKGKAEYGGGWLCWKKADTPGCGAKFADGDPAIVEQKVGKVDNPDLADSYNTVLKMADKRALIGAVLNGTAASDVFTQDVEDSAPADATSSSSTGAARQTGASSKASAKKDASTGDGEVAGAEKTTAAVTMPAAFKGDDGTRIMQALNGCDPTVDWAGTWHLAIVEHYGKTANDLNPKENVDAWTRLACVADTLTGKGDFPPPNEQEIAAAFGDWFKGPLVKVQVHEIADPG